MNGLIQSPLLHSFHVLQFAKEINHRGILRHGIAFLENNIYRFAFMFHGIIRLFLNIVNLYLIDS